MPIRTLSPLLISQIAAGEVVERPASVVKELVENAIDAGASRIGVAIEQGGRELIRVTDDGGGIPEDELPLALAAHATSKIEKSEDLEAIGTMGFRGEALASIASVSRISILSRTRDQACAALIECEGSEARPVRPASGPVGTTVTVRNLFFNTPARRKFLKSEGAETGRIGEIVRNLALAHPTVAFALSVDGKVRFDVPASQGARERAIAILGEELAPKLVEIRVDEHGLNIWGLAGHPALARPNARSQHVLLNGRVITDRSISHALREAYRGLIEPALQPLAVVHITLDPAQVDVNVHPAKTEVRFLSADAIHRAVRLGVQAALRKADIVPGLDLSRAGGANAPGALPGSGESDEAPGRTMRGGPGASVWTAPAAGGWSGGSSAGAGSGGAVRREGWGGQSQWSGARSGGFDPAPMRAALDSIGEMEQAIAAAPPASIEEKPLAGPARIATEAMQILDSFIVAPDEDCLIIIDQHALHERIMFEKLRARVQTGALESQRLLMPVVIPVERAHLEALDDLQPLLARLGIEASPMSASSVGVHAFTSLLFERNVDAGTFMEELLARAAEDGFLTDPEQALFEVLDMMSCKAAIKAGDRLSAREISELLSQREIVERATNCPHGRPTTLRLTRKDLERQFGRS